MSDRITIVEVGPRDGLQNESQFVDTNVKLTFINRLIEAGVSVIEATSFVSAQWIPQMADSDELAKQLPFHTSVRLPVLVPNEKGLQRALDCHAKDIAIFTAASETFSQKNTHRSIAQSLETYKTLIHEAKQAKLRVRGYVSCALGCPYEGHIDPTQVIAVASTLFQAGCDEIALGDTIGVGTPHAARNLIKQAATVIPVNQLAIHFHDTYGQALANIVVCLEEGIRIVDSAAAGLGGCPYAKGATGNVATEDVVYMLHGMGLHTGIDLDKLIDAGTYICQYLHHPSRSKVATAMVAKRNN